MSLHPSLIAVPAAALGIAVGWFCGAQNQHPMQTSPAPFNINDARLVIAKLLPLTPGDNTDVAIFLFANGDVNIDVHMGKYGESKLVGRGPSLPAAVIDLRNKGVAVANALEVAPVTDGH